jgi:RNA polymerase sigma-70 factor (ECF subfamily)
VPDSFRSPSTSSATPSGPATSALACKPAARARIQPHMAHVPGPDGKRREIELAPELETAWAAQKSKLADLVAAHEPWMRALAARRIPAHLKPCLDGDDVVQAAFLALCQRADAGEPELQGNVRSYLLQAVRNGVCDEVRRHTRRRRSADAEHVATDKMLALQVCPREQPCETIEKEELRATLLEALGQLSAMDRELVQMKHVEQRTWTEIGRLLDLPETTARRKGLEAFGRLMRLVES